MKNVLYISAKLALVTLGMKDFKHKTCIVCQKRKKELKYILACLCSTTTKILNIFLINPFILWTVLPFNTFMTDGNKRSNPITQCSS